jgi:hypothetical protein
MRQMEACRQAGRVSNLSGPITELNEVSIIMTTQVRHACESSVTLTRAGWLKVISSCVEPDFEPVPAQGHERKYRRYDVIFGGIKLLSLDDQPLEGIECALLQISLDGLLIKPSIALPMHAKLRAEVSLRGHTFILCGRVVHNTRMADGYKVGVRLRFPKASQPRPGPRHSPGRRL